MIELTIKRPNGEIEKIQTSKFGIGSISPVLFKKIQVATFEAGKGEVIGWEAIDTRTLEEKAAQAKETARLKAAGYCPKCGTFCYGDCQSH